MGSQSGDFGAFNAIRGAALRPGSSDPAADVDALIARAREHRLGVGFLLDGAHDAVAATFGVHAFVVDAARDRLRSASGTTSPSLR